MWAIAATLERARPVIVDWQMELHNLGYGRRMVSELFKEEAIQVNFTGPSVGCFLNFLALATRFTAWTPNNALIVTMTVLEMEFGPMARILCIPLTDY